MGKCVLIFWLFWFQKENKMALAMSLGVFQIFWDFGKIDPLEMKTNCEISC